MGAITDLHHSFGISFLSHIDPGSFVKSVVNTSLPSLSKNGNSPSDPTALQLLRKSISLITWISGGEPVSTWIGSLAGTSGTPTVGESTKLRS